MIDLIDAEVSTLRMLTGQLPLRIDAQIWICIEELRARGFCSVNGPPRATLCGIEALEAATGTIDFRSHLVSLIYGIAAWA